MVIVVAVVFVISWWWLSHLPWLARSSTHSLVFISRLWQRQERDGRERQEREVREKRERESETRE